MLAILLGMIFPDASRNGTEWVQPLDRRGNAAVAV
jgi:hypothetical protein